jgi:hypothetical protein
MGDEVGRRKWGGGGGEEVGMRKWGVESLESGGGI